MLFIQVPTVGVAPGEEEREQIPSIPRPPAGQVGMGEGTTGWNVSVCKGSENISNPQASL